LDAIERLQAKAPAEGERVHRLQTGRLNFLSEADAAAFRREFA
jgi:hypothetical protein